MNIFNDSDNIPNNINVYSTISHNLDKLFLTAQKKDKNDNVVMKLVG